MNNNNYFADKMNNNDLIIAINTVSGICSTPFWDSVYEKCKSTEALESLRNAINLLHEADENVKALEAIIAMHDMVDLNYPAELPIMTENNEIAEAFLLEFLADAEDILGEYYFEDDGPGSVIN